MEDRTIMALSRLVIGMALLITHAVTGVDGLIVSLAIFLLGVPLEKFIHAKKTT